MMSDDLERGQQQQQQQNRSSMAAYGGSSTSSPPTTVIGGASYTSASGGRAPSQRPSGSIAAAPPQQYGENFRGPPPAAGYTSSSRAPGSSSFKGTDADTATCRYWTIVFGIVVVICLGVVAIVLPLTLDSYCDCDPVILGPTPSPTRSPNEPPTPGEPTAAPSSPPSSDRFSQFVRNYAAAISGEEVFRDSTTPQYRAAEWITQANIDDTITSVDQLDDLYAVTVFYYSTGGDDWAECSQGNTGNCPGNSWLNDDVGPCDWEWITCNDGGRISDIVICKCLCLVLALSLL